MGLRSRRRGAPDTVVEDASVIGQEHAWWAEREHLQHPYVPPSRDHAAPDQDLRDFWSPESLFTYDRRDGDEVATEDVMADPYAVLGLPIHAAWRDVTAAHRRLAKQFHPDVVIDGSDRARAHAEERMREVNRAYSQIRRERERTVT